MQAFKEVEIWEPKWLTKTVLIGNHHTRGLPDQAVVRVVFSKWRGGPLYMSAGQIRTYPLASNGTIGCHAVPLGAFEREETINQEELRL